MSSFETEGHWQEALALLTDMINCALLPDVISFDTAMSACDKAEKWQEALELLAKLHSASLQEDVITCSALMSACVKAEQWALALRFFEEMKNIQRNIFVYTGAMKAFETCNAWMSSLLVFDDMMCSFLEADTVARNAVMGACSDFWWIAVGLLGSSVGQCDEVSYNTLLTACAKGQKRAMQPRWSICWTAACAYLKILPVKILEVMLPEGLDDPKKLWNYCNDLHSSKSKRRHFQSSLLSTSHQPICVAEHLQDIFDMTCATCASSNTTWWCGLRWRGHWETAEIFSAVKVVVVLVTEFSAAF